MDVGRAGMSMSFLSISYSRKYRRAADLARSRILLSGVAPLSRAIWPMLRNWLATTT